MNKFVPAEAFPPGEFLRDELEARGWTQTEFAEMIGRPIRLVNEVIAGKRAVTPETACDFADAFGTSAQLWMNLETAWQLSKVAPRASTISREANLRARFPVREMIKRGWIAASKSYDDVEESVLRFFGLEDVDSPILFPHAARRNYDEADVSSAQWAWIFRVNQLATAFKVPRFSASALENALPALERLMTEPEEVRHVPKILGDCGVRLIVVEPFPGSEIQGVCFWIENCSQPVIGLTLKGDHIDRFWFNLWHEIEHLLKGEGKTEIIMEDFDATAAAAESESEKAANEGAANRCVPTRLMKDFIARHNPMFSEKSLIGFSRLMKRHPGIVAGQIQRATNRWELFKKFQPKIRHIIIETAVTDGYGRTAPFNI